MAARGGKGAVNAAGDTKGRTVGGKHGAKPMVGSVRGHGERDPDQGGQPAPTGGAENKRVRGTGTTQGGSIAPGHPQTPRGAHSLVGGHGPGGVTGTTPVATPPGQGGGGKKRK